MINHSLIKCDKTILCVSCGRKQKAQVDELGRIWCKVCFPEGELSWKELKKKDFRGIK